MMLGLLLARAGVDVTVMEKHADFLRDFRGDTVHASTLRLLDELGLGSRFARIPHRLIDTIRMELQGRPVEVDLTRLPGPHQHIALVPQWDLLELLATAAQAEPTFRLLRSTEVTGLLRGDDGRRVLGVEYRDPSGETKHMRAELTVACDGRGQQCVRPWACDLEPSARRWTCGGFGCPPGRRSERACRRLQRRARHDHHRPG
ncbi:FAD binding domain protein [Mycobacterium kansasii]|uniref:FAD binding domain protein n=1 Tax=Mycobacterium kansasii TaxID=1768 RepID=A0A1V3XJY8_MYCKA|nr:FAD binding domain protein [Mycobacterium kansasii]